MRVEEYDTMRRVEDSHWWYRALRGHVTACLLQRLAAGQPAIILDAGCGSGGMMAALRVASPQWNLQGLDLSPEALTHTRQRGFSHLLEGSVNAIPLDDETCDAVLSLDVLYHEEVEESRAVGEFARVLRPGGLLVLNLAAFDCLAGGHDKAVRGARRYTKSKVRALLEAQGFTLKSLHYWNALWFLPLLVRRKLTRHHSMEEAGSDLFALPGWLNALLHQLARADIALCRALHLPLGTSVFALAQKPGHDPRDA